MSRHWLLATEVLLNRLPFAVVAAMLGWPAILLLVLAARYAQALALHRATGAALTVGHILTLPLLDALMLYAWFVPFFSNRITWRGCEARIGRGTELIQAAALALALNRVSLAPRQRGEGGAQRRVRGRATCDEPRIRLRHLLPARRGEGLSIC